MSGRTDVAKGKIKEAAGALINNDELRQEGKDDQAVGKAKKVVEKTVRTIKEGAEKAIDKVKNAAE
jgi:uncharacterized protein YjbJ (UPF0337 family)